MPCFRCGARQTDPVRGASPWKRGVRHETQVLICPDCQSARDLDLDICSSCGSIALIRRLGEVECRSCGTVHPARPEEPPADQHPEDGPATEETARDDRAATAGPGFPEPEAPDPPEPGLYRPNPNRPDLSEEVKAALERVLGRSSG